MVAASWATMHPEEAGPMAQTISVLGLAIAKLVFHVVGREESGQVVRRKRLARSTWLTVMATVPPLRIGMEACGSAHDGARCVREQGHDGRLMAPPLVNASVTSPTHEARAAKASCEAVTRPTRRFGPIARVEPPDLQARQRIRERLITARTALVKAIRGRLNEDGSVLPPSLAKVRAWMVAKLEPDPAPLTALSPEVFWHLADACRAVETCRASADETCAARGQAPPACQRLQTMPGSGPVRATARLAAIGDVTQGKHGRQLAAGWGVVPRDHAPGGTPRVLGMSHRGDVDLRTWLVQGARATRRWIETPQDERRQGLTALMARRGTHRAAVA
jgi:transposase